MQIYYTSCKYSIELQMHILIKQMRLFYFPNLFLYSWMGITYRLCKLHFFFKTCLFLAVLGLHCCVWAFLGAERGGHSSLWCTGYSLQRLLLLWSVDSRCAGFSSRGAGPWLLCSMWNRPWIGIKPLSPALVGRFLTTRSPGKSCSSFL